MNSLIRDMGTPLATFLKATILGGLLFLMPLVVVLVVMGQAMRLAGKVAQPLSALLPVSAEYRVGVVSLLAVLGLVAVSLGAGLLARTMAGKRLTHWFENSWLAGIPQYQLLKSMAQGLAQIENDEAVRAVLVSIEGGWQIGYSLETLENGLIVVLLPQAPTPLSGNLMYMPADRVHPLGITMVQAMAIVKRVGVGSREALQGNDLPLPLSA